MNLTCWRYVQFSWSFFHFSSVCIILRNIGLAAADILEMIFASTAKIWFSPRGTDLQFSLHCHLQLISRFFSLLHSILKLVIETEFLSFSQLTELTLWGPGGWFLPPMKKNKFFIRYTLEFISLFVSTSNVGVYSKVSQKIIFSLSILHCTKPSMAQLKMLSSIALTIFMFCQP